MLRKVLNRSIVVLKTNDAVNMALSIRIDDSARTFVGMVVSEVLSIPTGVQK